MEASEPKLYFEVNQTLDLIFNARERVRMGGFSPDYHHVDFIKETDNWLFSNRFHMSILLKLKCIHIWCILEDEQKRVLMNDFKMIKYWGAKWNVICVERI
eukprot:TRINITY_DN19418_c0_g1_i1.p1 TRINITY_DN19418_c0_g1~~TRINITY_DN19418_c0_g1_i1.p1  ORF type:complete len:101 (-),score=13.48 TRINITY_DN19418_c0_g1_i1:17-319(-)